MKNNNSMISLEVLIKNLKVLYLNLRGNTLPKIDKIKFQNSLVSNNKKKENTYCSFNWGTIFNVSF